MKKFLFTMMLMVGTMTMLVSDADAKRFGGGGSSGRQSNNVSRQATPAAPNQAKPAATPATAGAVAVPPKPSSPWKGIVGGLVGGALLGAMFSSMGMGGGLASALGSILPMILLAGAAFFLFRMYQNRKGSSTPSVFAPQAAYAGASGSPAPFAGNRFAG